MANHDLILVLEEDAILQPNFATEIEKLVETFTLDIPTICQLFTRGERFVQSSSLQSYSVNRFLYQFASIPGQTVAYLINRLAIDFALRHDAIAGPPDWPNWASSLDFKGVYPFLVTESELGSSIGSPDFSRWKHWMRLVSVTTLKHFFRFHKSYHGFRSYYKLELLPLILRLRWRLNGRQTMPAGSVRDNLWLV